MGHWSKNTEKGKQTYFVTLTTTDSICERGIRVNKCSVLTSQKTGCMSFKKNQLFYAVCFGNYMKNVNTLNTHKAESFSV